MDFGARRLDNWVVTKYEKDGVPFIQVKPVNGECSWEYSSLDKKFIEIENAFDNNLEEALAACFAVDYINLHNETGVYHLVYTNSMDMMTHIAIQRNLKEDANVIEIIQEAFKDVKTKIDELYGGAVDPTEVTEQDKEIVEEMKTRHELEETLKKENYDNLTDPVALDVMDSVTLGINESIV